MIALAVRYWKGLAFVGAFLTGFLMAWHVQGLRCDSKLAKIERQAVEAREVMRAQMEAAATDYETFRAGNETAETRTQTQIREVYRNVEVPSDCAVHPDAVRLLNDAREAANRAATGKPESALQDD